MGRPTLAGALRSPEVREAGELLENRERSTGLGDLTRYADDPMGFIRDVLDGDPWERQEDVARAVMDHPLVTVRSCHAAGKDWLAARLALWWCYARQGLVVLTGPTAAQVEEILMRGEVRSAFRGAGLPGALHVKALRPGGGDKAGILAKTATGVSSLTGFHDARVLFIITEAQSPDIEHAWDAAFACTTGAEDRVLTLGNPTEPTGRFYRAHQPGSDWHAMKIGAEGVPNVREGETVVPGLLTREGVRRFASEYGTDSGFYQSRVPAEFPTEASDSLIRRDWLEAAAERHDRGELLAGPSQIQPEPVVAVDPARYGPDASVLAVVRGGHVEELTVWTGRQDTMELTGRVVTELREVGVEPEQELEGEEALQYQAERAAMTGDFRRVLKGLGGMVTVGGRGTVVVDEIGLGSGVLDRLAELGYDAEGFNGSKSPRSYRDRDKFANLRAAAFWRLRKALEQGEVALPRDEELWQELTTIGWRPDSAGRVQIESKDDLKSRLGRSPDRADAVCMAVEHHLGGPPAYDASEFRDTKGY